VTKIIEPSIVILLKLTLQHLPVEDIYLNTILWEGTPGSDTGITAESRHIQRVEMISLRMATGRVSLVIKFNITVWFFSTWEWGFACSV
jgi:hypothetical protein